MDEQGAYGDQHGHKKIINVCDGWELAEVMDTLTHEVFHAIWEFMNLPSRVKEEQAVHALASGFIMVLKDNPDLVRLYEELK